MRVVNTPNRGGPSSGAEFAELLERELSGRCATQGRIVAAQIVALDSEAITVEVSPETRALIPAAEFGRAAPDLKTGDYVEVYAGSVREGLTLSRIKARRAKAWRELERKFNAGELVNGKVVTAVNGGFIVRLEDESAFLPGSQVDVRPLPQSGQIIGMEGMFKIIAIDADRENLVVSRREVLEQQLKAERSKLLEQMNEGDVREGKVKHIVDYGAFVDIGGVDALLHVTDMAWKRLEHPNEMLSVGDTIKVTITRINRDALRISLGLKQLAPDPWETAAVRYEIGIRLSGVVRKIVDYGVFVEIEPGIEGLLHKSEVCWGGLKGHPSKLFSLKQRVEVILLEIDFENRRISLSMKRLSKNPWIEFSRVHSVGAILEGAVTAVYGHNVRVQLPNNLEGAIDLSVQTHLTTAHLAPGDILQVTLINVDAERESIEVGLAREFRL